jgi:hypothetical protein
MRSDSHSRETPLPPGEASEMYGFCGQYGDGGQQSCSLMQLAIGLHPDETVLPWIIVGTEVGVLMEAMRAGILQTADDGRGATMGRWVRAAAQERGPDAYRRSCCALHPLQGRAMTIAL